MQFESKLKQSGGKIWSNLKNRIDHFAHYFDKLHFDNVELYPSKAEVGKVSIFNIFWCRIGAQCWCRNDGRIPRKYGFAHTVTELLAAAPRLLLMHFNVIANLYCSSVPITSVRSIGYYLFCEILSIWDILNKMRFVYFNEEINNTLKCRGTETFRTKQFGRFLRAVGNRTFEICVNLLLRRAKVNTVQFIILWYVYFQHLSVWIPIQNPLTWTWTMKILEIFYLKLMWGLLLARSNLASHFNQILFSKQSSRCTAWPMSRMSNVLKNRTPLRFCDL